LARDFEPDLGKCEFPSPGGNDKDRIAKATVDDAEARPGLDAPWPTRVK